MEQIEITGKALPILSIALKEKLNIPFYNQVLSMMCNLSQKTPKTNRKI